jgi:hypothetical protein
MSLYFSCETFPANPTIKDSAGIPWGAVLQPLDEISTSTDLHSGDIPRCEECFGYINPYAYLLFLCARFQLVIFFFSFQVRYDITADLEMPFVPPLQRPA